MAPPSVQSLDHLVLTVRDIPSTCRFYQDILGMRAEAFEAADGTRRWALYFGRQKINLHEKGKEFEPKADIPQPGSADLCFLSDTPMAEWQAHLQANDVFVEAGPLLRSGAVTSILSIYIRDPDSNLIEISNAC